MLPLLLAEEKGQSVDAGELRAAVRLAVKETVEHQVDTGIDVLNDGEVSKLQQYAGVVGREDVMAGTGGSGPSPGCSSWCPPSPGPSSGPWRRGSGST